MHPSGTDPIPIVTVGGFLGAGKTTLVNNMLAQADGQRIVVFVNDFGAINIDYNLIETQDTDRISLKNGCVCCTLNDDLIASIVDFCRHSPPDAFVIEASGVANPQSLAQTIQALQSAGHVRMDNRIYVLDGDLFGALDYEDTENLIDHAAASDLVLINKSDLVERGRFEKTRALLARSCPRSMILDTTRCSVPLNVLLSGKSNEPSAPVADEFIAVSNRHHVSDYSSWCRADFAPVKRQAFTAFVAGLVGTAVRAKGIVHFEDDPETPVVFDLVGTRQTYRLLDSKDEIHSTGFVAIGRSDHADLQRLEMQFDALLSDC